MKPTAPLHVYEVRPRIDHRGVDLISDVLPFGRLWYGTPDHAVGYAMQNSRSHHAVIRVYDGADNMCPTLHASSAEFTSVTAYAARSNRP